MPRAGLTRPQVAAVAADVADEVGLDALTLSEVAQRLGVSQPALYKHVPGIDALRRDVAVLAVQELTAALRAVTEGRRGGAALHALAGAYRGYATAHPGRVAASVRAPAPGDDEHARVGDDAVAVLVGVLKDYGVASPDMVHAVRAVRASLHGFVVLEAAGGFGLPESVDESFDRLVAGLDLTLSQRAPLS